MHPQTLSLGFQARHLMLAINLCLSKEEKELAHLYLQDMNSVARRLSSLFGTSGFTTEPFKIGHHQMQQLQQCRGIRVRVLNGNLEMALGLMQRKMQGSGIERMIKQEQRFHIKNSEKRVLAQKNLERRLRSEDYARKLKAILLKKVRGL